MWYGVQTPPRRGSVAKKLPRRRRLPANDPRGFTPYQHIHIDPADSNHDRRAPTHMSSTATHLSTIDSTLFHGFSTKCHFYAILSTDNPIHVSTRATTLPLTHDETGSARHTHSHRLTSRQEPNSHRLASTHTSSTATHRSSVTSLYSGVVTITPRPCLWA